MKILAVHLRNLNSLAGSWSIDFTTPEYAASGIFAITGPTGAGKSTILDAICLALFAQTPRLGHISKSSNEIMSRRAGDCFAEVTFETQAGRYRCHWGQHRARRSADGELQAPRHEIVDADTGKVMETRTKEVSRLVEQVTGMDYDRFTRSILLAQGGFAAFLEADADQRAPILEQITGTGIYSQISIAVYERTSEERKKTANLQEAMGNILLLGEEEEKALEAGLGEGLASVVQLQQRLTLLGEALHRIKAIGALKAQLIETDQQLLDLASRREESREDLHTFDRGQRAQTLLGAYTRIKQIQERMATLRSKGEELHAAWERLQQEQGLMSEDHVRTCQQVQESLEVQSQETEKIKTVRVFDLHIYEKKKAIGQLSVAQQQTEKEQQDYIRLREDLNRQQSAVAVQAAQLDVFFREHESDSLLVEHLAGFRQQLLQLGERAGNLSRLTRIREENRLAQVDAIQHHSRLFKVEQQAEHELAGLRQRQQQLQEQREELLAGKDHASWRVQVEQGEKRLRQLEQTCVLLGRQKILEEELATLGRSLREVQEQEQQQSSELRAQEEKRGLQQQLVAQCEKNHQLALHIHSYEEERKHLVDGDACPLCGATHHPWADARPVLEASDSTLSQARAELERMLANTAQLRETLVSLGKDREYAVTMLAKGQRQRQEFEEQLGPLLALLEGPAVTDRPAQAAELLEQWQVQVEALRSCLKTIERLEAELHAVHTQLEQATTLHADLLRQVQAAQHTSETLASEGRRLEEQAGEEQAHIDRSCTELLAQLLPLGIRECPPEGAENLLIQLEARQQAWKEQQQRREGLIREQARLQAEQDKVDLLLTGIARTLSQQSAELETLNRAEAVLLAERFELYGDRDPNLEEQKVQTLVRQAQAQEMVSRTRLGEIDKELHGMGEQRRIGSEELEMLLPQSRELEAELLDKLQLAGFVDLPDYCGALLAPEVLAALGQRKEALEKERAVLAARKAEQTVALEREEELHRGQKGQAELLEEEAGHNLQLAIVQQQIGADRERLAANSLRKQQSEEQRQAVVAQKKEQVRWDLLHQLIGSADGKKFRVFAQGLTFDVMISHANRQLRKMNDRYILLRDPKEPLALQVIDNYQAGEVRSTRNLSGGESFLVSLALSLGLSAMASHNVRVDSLFLDEGFGTLDEEALETALQTLAELQHDGKLIGIISHVPLLKERIDVRIQVVPGTDGCSRLVGPGCRKSS
jgi:exonuclease SbcC